MPTLVIVGAQWGDEAKGKLVDVLGSKADLVVRYSGGNNAGHTVIVGGQEFRFHLIPAGILHPAVTAVLGSGMVVCPKGLLEEYDRTRELRPDLGRLAVSKAAHVVFPYHRTLDALEEQAKGDNKVGTTSRGIGPAYQDKASRIGIRMGEFVEPRVFRERLREVLEYKNRLLSLLGGEPMDFEALHDEYAAYAERIRPWVAETDVLVQEAVASGKRVLFEGAQGSMLDLDCGTYPFVTSSHPVAGGACLGTGIGPRAIDGVVGVCKAYTTRVGSGPFPTELLDETGDWIRTKGHEFGTTTGRGRRCGWLDLVVLRHSARVNSLTGLVVTRLDVLSGLERLLVCTSYRLDGEQIVHVPSNTFELAAVEPVYESLPGWDGDLRSCRRWDDLPRTARDYLRFLEEFTSVPIAAVSVGPDREETVPVRPELLWGG
ncbi:MAG: adenylosuccinate synthase [Fimbriimonadales bacterium]|nr:adenylosuccinate synthase [Fimbriimonadales bacterium]